MPDRRWREIVIGQKAKQILYAKAVFATDRHLNGLKAQWRDWSLTCGLHAIRRGIRLRKKRRIVVGFLRGRPSREIIYALADTLSRGLLM